MKVTEHLRRAAGRTLFSIEIIPPLKGHSIRSIYQAIDPLMEFNPPFIDVTYHREEYVYKKRENGLLEKVSIRKRPGTVGICAAIINRYKTDAVPHIICGGFNREETENALIDLAFLGIDNVLLLRGDAIKTEAHFAVEPGGNAYAIDLVRQVVNLNKGVYIDEDLINVQPTDFCIGVAGYPEKHFEAPNLKSDLNHLKQKVDAGAEYIVTQMFFDNRRYFDFVAKCRAAGIDQPQAGERAAAHLPHRYPRRPAGRHRKMRFR
jgi:methylenetetrahydrofolate reductase (NADPH)